jgi:hypothetical protein
VVEITAIIENAAVSKRKAGDETSHARLTIIHERLRLITASFICHGRSEVFMATSPKCARGLQTVMHRGDAIHRTGAHLKPQA